MVLPVAGGDTAQGRAEARRGSVIAAGCECDVPAGPAERGNCRHLPTGRVRQQNADPSDGAEKSVAVSSIRR